MKQAERLMAFRFLKGEKLRRDTGLDCLRICSMLAVVVIHTCGGLLQKGASFAVVSFVMMSGAIHLSESYVFDVKKWCLSIVKIVLAFLLWSGIYIFWDPNAIMGEGLIKKIVIGPYHFWFCYMIVGVYLTIPLIMAIKRNEQLYKYLFVILFAITILAPTLAKIPQLSGAMLMIEWLRIFDGMEYVFFFVTGDVVFNCISNKYCRCCFYLLGIVSAVLVLTTGGGDNDLRTMFYAIGVFTVIVWNGRKIKNAKISTTIESLSKRGFTVYLVHVLIIDIASRFFAFEGIVKAVIVFLISLILAYSVNALGQFVRYTIMKRSFG